MCYRKPGPRCSSHAALALANAKQEVSVSHGSSPDEYFSAKDKEREAQAAFDATPAGLKIMQDELLNARHEPGLDERYKAAKMLREQQLDAVKKLKLTPTVHDVQQNDFSAFTHAHVSSDEVRENVNMDKLHASMSTLSENYFSRLSDEEISQLRWMTDYGAMEANKHIAGVNSYSQFNGAFPAEDIDNRMKVVDEALRKYSPAVPVITYRGVRDVSLPVKMRENYRVSQEDKQKAFLDSMPVGSVVSSDFYQPTSFQPSSSVKFADFNVVMEIKSSSAAPVSALSVSSVEHEGLLPRNVTFTVVAVQQNVKYDTGNVDRKTGEPVYRVVTVVQLEENK